MMTRSLTRSAKALAVAGALVAGAAHAGTVEVLHWWTSGGEAAAVNELKDMLETKGHEWEDFAVAGGGGESAMTALKSRVISGNPPGAAQIKGPAIQQWGDLGVLADLSEVASTQSWDELLPEVVADVMKVDGQYVAAPVNVHRINWLWANPEVFEKAGVEIPGTWEEFVSAAEKIREAGFTPVAQGGQPWQESTVFETLVYGVGGADLYRRAFIEQSPEALSGEQMQEAFRRLRVFKGFTDPNAAGRDWNLATRMVIEDEAAMQVMGDWAKGEFTSAEQKPGEDYVCSAFPGTEDAFLFNIDSFVMFQVSGDDRAAQMALAETIMEPEFQRLFNTTKGSIPVRTDMSMDGFDDCAVQAMDTFKASADSGSLLPSMAHGMAVFPATQGAIFDTVTQFYNSEMSPAEAAQKLAEAVAAAEPGL
ncbi:ABC transporter substrate-binding protein [Arhodomonas sp. AD133]|uniref:ABC transporter substrate-binding protein n=1 Tax=Arhodomonas sp. AD133 TaxID=3415009 RepID=UPI003EBC4529